MSILITFVIVAVIISLLFKSVSKDRKTTDANETYSGNQRRGKRNYGKWIGGGLGWAFGGPLGAIIGFAIGSAFGNNGFQQDQPLLKAQIVMCPTAYHKFLHTWDQLITALSNCL